MKETVYMALSGGVDSAAAAALLLRQGFDVRGVMLRLKPGSSADADIADAQSVASMLGIPLDVLDCRDEFKKVTDYFCDEYLHGRTPNPCVFCNPTLKFGKILEYALLNGADKIATGHYAGIYTAENGDIFIRRTATKKDQSYFLCRLKKETLAHVIFPLENTTKDEARALAAAAGLPVAEKKDSQEVCFIPDNDYISFIERERRPEAKPGDFIFTDGTKAGTHGGLYKYTVGQRKGLGAFGVPMYAVALDYENNTVTVGGNDALFKTRVEIFDLSFINGTLPVSSVECFAKIRCAAPPAKAVLTVDGTRGVLEFCEPQRAAAPGQTAAIYIGDLLIGGGTIC